MQGGIYQPGPYGECVRLLHREHLGTFTPEEAQTFVEQVVGQRV